QHALGLARTVDVGGVEQRNALGQRGGHYRVCSGLIDAHAKVVAAQAQGRNGKAAASYASVLHVGLLHTSVTWSARSTASTCPLSVRPSKGARSGVCQGQAWICSVWPGSTSSRSCGAGMPNT